MSAVARLLLVVSLPLVGLTAACKTTGNCESDPIGQFRLDGRNFISAGETVVSSDLGDEVGTIDQGLPAAAYSCTYYILEDGMGSPPAGSKVYKVHSRNSAKWLAVIEPGSDKARLYQFDEFKVLG